MRKNIEALITSDFNANQVANETGLPRNTVYRIFSREANLDNITLKNAEILSAFWESCETKKEI